MTVRYSYLLEQFEKPDAILDAIREVVSRGDFTLGAAVGEFERRFAELIGTKHAVGVGSGTDALKLALRAVGVGPGDEVITAANTFIATVGAIAETGARTVFIDCDDTFCMDVSQLEGAITEKTKAILPVHLTGHPADMETIVSVAEKHGIKVVEDACQGILAETGGRRVGTWGDAAGYSLHPLKNLNVWGDAGVVVTDDDTTAERLRLLRNHGMRNRDEIDLLGYNSRLDTVQAVVGNWLIGDTEMITAKRIANAEYLDQQLTNISGIRLPPRSSAIRHVYHLYMVFSHDRDGLMAHCESEGIEAKIHYPIPLYQQKGLQHLGYKAGDFPVSDRHIDEIITFPVDQHLETADLDQIVAAVRGFYAR